MTMRERLNRIVLLLVLLIGSATAHAEDASALKAGVFDPPREAPDFTLPGSNGAELKLSAYRGKVVLLGFGFTSCAAVCPITLGTLKQVNKKLGAQASELQVIYITVDPEHDDAARLKKYLSSFDPNFIGGTGRDFAHHHVVYREHQLRAHHIADEGGAVAAGDPDLRRAPEPDPTR